jgi:hypothetical protein
LKVTPRRRLIGRVAVVFAINVLERVPQAVAKRDFLRRKLEEI